MTNPFSGKKAAFALPLAAALLAFGAASAAAKPLIVAPGGNSGSCNQAIPCSLGQAVQLAKAGDEIVMQPGSYANPDLKTAAEPAGAGISLPAGVSVHGVAGAPRPVITLSIPNSPATSAGITVSPTASLAHVEVVTAVTATPIATLGSGPGPTVEDVISRSAAPGGTACVLSAGVVRDAVCLSSGARGIALGSNTGSLGPIMSTIELRNVTALASGPESFGIAFGFAGIPGAEELRAIEGLAVIARGTEDDVLARSLSLEPHTSGGAEIRVTLAHSDFAKVLTEADGAHGTVTVTQAGTNGNLSAAPLLAGDGFHELPGSPTIDAGAVDALSPAAAIEGPLRVVGSAPDIGADEFVPAAPPSEARHPKPDTRLLRKPKKKTASRRARFTFASRPHGAHFRCKLDNRRYRACRSPFSASVKPGRHTFRVQAIDSTGSADPTPATFRWTVTKPKTGRRALSARLLRAF